MDSKILLSPPHMGGNELKYITEAFESNWISPFGANITGFENLLCDFLGVKHCVVLNSGTAGIHLSLVNLDVKAVDEVICSTFTFSATCNPIIYQGAIPIFVDSEKDTWNMDPELLERAIKDRLKKGKKPKAIILVHLYGMPAKLDGLFAIANKYEIPIIEDAAEALGSCYHGKHVGTTGIMGVLSFNGNKIITTSGGGALVSNDAELIEKARFLANQARDAAPHYQHTQIGYNYRMSNIIAGIGRGQMEVLEDRIEKRRANQKFYFDHLCEIEGIKFLLESPDHFSNYWLTTILFEPSLLRGIDREIIRNKLLERNIESRPLWKPMHLQPVFKDCPSYINGVAEDLFNKGLCLPSGSNLSDRELTLVVKSIRQIIGL